MPCFWQVRKTAQDAVKTILESPPGDMDYHPATTATTKFCVQQIEQLGGMEVRPGHQRLTSPFNLLAVVYMYMQYGDIGRWSLFYCINYFSIIFLGTSNGENLLKSLEIVCLVWSTTVFLKTTLTWMITLDKQLTPLGSNHLICHVIINLTTIRDHLSVSPYSAINWKENIINFVFGQFWPWRVVILLVNVFVCSPLFLNMVVLGNVVHKLVAVHVLASALLCKN